MIPNGVVSQAGAFARDVSAACVFMAKPPANNIATKAAAIRWDERRIIFLGSRTATKVADVKSSAGKDRQDAHKRQPQCIRDRFDPPDIFANEFCVAPRAVLAFGSARIRDASDKPRLIGGLVLDLCFSLPCGCASAC